MKQIASIVQETIGVPFLLDEMCLCKQHIQIHTLVKKALSELWKFSLEIQQYLNGLS